MIRHHGDGKVLLAFDFTVPFDRTLADFAERWSTGDYAGATRSAICLHDFWERRLDAHVERYLRAELAQDGP